MTSCLHLFSSHLDPKEYLKNVKVTFWNSFILTSPLYSLDAEVHGSWFEFTAITSIFVIVVHCFLKKVTKLFPPYLGYFPSHLCNDVYYALKIFLFLCVFRTVSLLWVIWFLEWIQKVNLMIWWVITWFLMMPSPHFSKPLKMCFMHITVPVNPIPLIS